MNAGRGYNPYAPPRDRGPALGADELRAGVPARLGARAFAAALDVSVEIVVYYGGGIVGKKLIEGSAYRAWHPAAAFVCAALLPQAIQAASIAQSGQSLGKRAMQMRIVLADGRRAGLLEGFVLRTLPVVVLALAPWMLDLMGGSREESAFWLVLGCWAALFIDGAMVLGAQRRCLHDRIAGTHVVQVLPPRLRGTDQPDLGKAVRRRAEVHRSTGRLPAGGVARGGVEGEGRWVGSGTVVLTEHRAGHPASRMSCEQHDVVRGSHAVIGPVARGARSLLPL